MSNSIIPKVLIAFTQTLINFNIAVNISCLNYYFCNHLWQKNWLNYNGSSCKENSPPLKGEPVSIETHTGDFGPCHFLHQRSLNQTQVAKPELKPEPEIAPEPKPTKSDQAREPAKSPLPVGLLVEYEGMSWSFTPSTDSISAFRPFRSSLAPCSSAPPGSVSCWTSLGSFISLGLPQTSTPLAVPCPSIPFAPSAFLTSGFTLVFGCTVYTQACQAPISTLVQWACSSKHGPPGLQCHLGTSSSWICLGLCLLWLRLSLLCHWFCLVGLHCDSSLPWLRCGFASWLLLLEFRPDSSSFLFALASPVSASTLAFTSFFSTLSSPFLISTLASDSTLAPSSIISSVVVPSVMPLSSSGSSTS